MNEQTRRPPLPGTLSGTLRERLRAGQFVMTAELVPPLGCDAQELLRKAAALKGVADAVNVTDGAGARAHMSALAGASLLFRAGIEPILQMTCRDKNRLALQSEMMGAAALGIRNLLLLSGDDPKSGDQPETKPVFDVDSRTLIETARRLREDAKLPTGRKVSGKADFFIGAADMPIDPPDGWEPKGLAAKIAAGAQFAQTQFCMDAAIVRRYVGALDATSPLRHDHPGRFHCAARSGRRSGARGPGDLRRIDRGAVHHPWRRRRAHHGPEQRCSDPGGDQRRTRAHPTRGALSPFLHRADVDLRRQRAVYRTPIGDFQEPLAIIRRKIALQRDHALDAVEHALFGFAFGAVGGVDAAVTKAHADALERQSFMVGIEPQRHRGAGTKCC